MSKKKFIDGLESVFTVLEEETVEHYDANSAEQPVTSPIQEAVKPKRGGKSFTADIGSAMQDNFVTTEDAFLSTTDDTLSLSEVSKKTMRKPLTGLDALLRRTIESSDLDNETKRRVVLILESGKLEKLKYIAKEESIFLKDIIERSVNFFIEDYERHKSLG
jgi:hypothetical protein